MSQYVPTFGGKPDPYSCRRKFEAFKRKGRWRWYVRMVGDPFERIPYAGPFWQRLIALRVADSMSRVAADAHYVALMDERAPRDEQGRTAWEIICDEARAHPQRALKGDA